MKVFKEYKLWQKRPLKRKGKKTTNRIPLILTYNRTLPDVKKVTANNWNLLQIKKEFQDIFQQTPILACRINKNLHDLLVCKNIVNNRVQKNLKNKIGFSIKCFSKSGNLCWWWNRETCVANKFYIQSVLEAISLKKLTTSSITLIVKANL